MNTAIGVLILPAWTVAGFRPSRESHPELISRE